MTQVNITHNKRPTGHIAQPYIDSYDKFSFMDSYTKYVILNNEVKLILNIKIFKFSSDILMPNLSPLLA